MEDQSNNTISSATGGLLTVKDVARILKVPVSWVYEQTRPGCVNPIPHFKLGKYLRFFDDDIRAYLEQLRSKNCRVD
jgi:predicted DNA-binding transcriptional regulator AlpA